MKEAKDTSWQQRSRRLRAELGCPQCYRGWTESHVCQGVPLRKRDFDCVDVAHWCWKMSSAQVDSRGHPCWFVDTSQMVEVQRRGETSGTQAQNSRWHSFALDAVLGPQDRPARVRPCMCMRVLRTYVFTYLT